MNPGRPVSFLNRSGQRLYGILHPGTRRDVAVVLLSPGVKMRVAPHRLYNKLASRIAALGFSVLRFDFAGLGDAEGEIGEKLLADFYGTVQHGRYIDDTRAAIDWLQQELGINSIIAAGLCGGAITGLLAATRDERITALFGIGIPVILDSANADHDRYLTAGQAESLRRSYLAKLLDIKSWLRLLTLRSDVGLIIKSLWRSRAPRNKSAATAPAAGNVNPHFAPAFLRLLAGGRRALLVFSGADRLTWEFEEKFRQPYAAQLTAQAANYEVHTIANANHILASPAWEAEMWALLEAWLRRYYASGSSKAA